MILSERILDEAEKVDSAKFKSGMEEPQMVPKVSARVYVLHTYLSDTDSESYPRYILLYVAHVPNLGLASAPINAPLYEWVHLCVLICISVRAYRVE